MVSTGVPKAPVNTAGPQPSLHCHRPQQQRSVAAMATVQELQATPGVCAHPDPATKVRSTLFVAAASATVVAMHSQLITHTLEQCAWTVYNAHAA
jgi:hypothetical protein